MSSTELNIPGLPISPNIGYYNSHNLNNGVATTDPDNNSYTNLKTNLEQSCKSSKSWNDINGIYDLKDTAKKIKKDVSNSLDIPFYLAKEGTLTNNLYDTVRTQCRAGDTGYDRLKNQIQYLTCQLQNERNRVYNTNEFTLFTHGNSVTSIFEKAKGMKVYLILIFLISIYIFISGFFGSLDICVNIFRSIEKNTTTNYLYWIGLLLGLAIPIVTLCVIYSQIVCKNLTYLEKYEITNNPYGIKREFPSDLKKFDIITLVLFILLIYAFVAVLFTIKESALGVHIYTALIGLILFIISSFIYVLYVYVPFFNTNKDRVEMVNNRPQQLHVFIDQQQTPSNISTNQYEIQNIKTAFLNTFIVIFIMAILFFIIVKKDTNKFVSGLLSSSAILILPLLWVFNFIIAFDYFYIYPLLYIIIRFIRYAIMSVVYIMSENSSLKDNFSDDLLEQLSNFKNYSPTWGLIGVDELKLFLHIIGYENSFSKLITPNNEAQNVAQNKYVSSGGLAFIVEFLAGKSDNKTGIIYSIVIFILSIAFSLIMLASVGVLTSKN